jgi:hypothetical protein
MKAATFDMKVHSKKEYWIPLSLVIPSVCQFLEDEHENDSECDLHDFSPVHYRSKEMLHLGQDREALEA